MTAPFEFALACDIIVASETATFALPEAKIGWAAIGGGVQRLPEPLAHDVALVGEEQPLLEVHPHKQSLIGISRPAT